MAGIDTVPLVSIDDDTQVPADLFESLLNTASARKGRGQHVLQTRVDEFGRNHRWLGKQKESGGEGQTGSRQRVNPFARLQLLLSMGSEGDGAVSPGIREWGNSSRLSPALPSLRTKSDGAVPIESRRDGIYSQGFFGRSGSRGLSKSPAIRRMGTPSPRFWGRSDSRSLSRSPGAPKTGMPSPRPWDRSGTRSLPSRKPASAQADGRGANSIESRRRCKSSARFQLLLSMPSEDSSVMSPATLNTGTPSPRPWGRFGIRTLPSLPQSTRQPVTRNLNKLPSLSDILSKLGVLDKPRGTESLHSDHSLVETDDAAKLEYVSHGSDSVTTTPRIGMATPQWQSKSNASTVASPQWQLKSATPTAYVDTPICHSRVVHDTPEQLSLVHSPVSVCVASHGDVEVNSYSCDDVLKGSTLPCDIDEPRSAAHGTFTRAPERTAQKLCFNDTKLLLLPIARRAGAPKSALDLVSVSCADSICPHVGGMFVRAKRPAPDVPVDASPLPEPMA